MTGSAHISPASLPGVADRTITISGFSKVFSITGWRVGYVQASARWTPAISYFHDLTYVCAPSPFQHGAAAGLECSCRIRSICRPDPGVPAQAPDDLRGTARGGDGAERAGGRVLRAGRCGGGSRRRKYRESNESIALNWIASVPGEAFFQGGRGDHLLRFCFAKTDSDLADACESADPDAQTALN